MDPLKTSQEIMDARNNEGNNLPPAAVDPIQDLRRNVFNFFTDRLDRIKKKEALLEKIQEALEDQVDGGTLTFDQLKSLFSSVSREQSSASEGIISLFRPVPGTPSIFANNIGNADHQDPYREAFNSMPPDKLQKIDALFRFLESAGAKIDSDGLKSANDDPAGEVVVSKEPSPEST